MTTPATPRPRRGQVHRRVASTGSFFQLCGVLTAIVTVIIVFSTGDASAGTAFALVQGLGLAALLFGVGAILHGIAVLATDLPE